jgi:cytochrome d ubiquinol oxidase subunit I
MFNDAALIEGLHMVVAAFQAVGFAVAGLHALLFLRTRLPVHALALRIALTMGALAALAQPLVGHVAAEGVAERQPAKLAAMEALFETQTRAPLLVGGIPDEETGTVVYAIELPGLLSLLAHRDLDSEVMGLDRVPREDWPPVTVVHFAFQIMVAIGSLQAAVGAAALAAMRWWPDRLNDRRVLLGLFAGAPLGFVAIEAGWTVTEVGRQPWIIYGLMRTADALTPRPGVSVTLLGYALLYGLLTGVVVLLLHRQIQALHRQQGVVP